MDDSTARNKLIVALDVARVDEARRLFMMLRGIVGMFKIGSQLFTAAGPSIVREIVAADGRVFLDLKFHDIPSTVARAGLEAARLNVSIFNVHALGGGEMMQRTVDAVAEDCARENLRRPQIIAVTVLTSADAQTLSDVGINDAPETQVIRLARLAAACAMDGVVASPREIQLVKANINEARDFIIVTPGVRPAEIETHDQRRVMTPAEAIRAGADYLVVGRPILEADDPVEAAMKIVEEIKEAISDLQK
jgi:orotidine-5'-phosphate decarboxylase